MHATRTLSPPDLRIAVRGTSDVDIRARFERALETTVLNALAPAGNAPIVDQVRWHFGFGEADGERRGKRLRPRLLFAVARGEGATYEDALDAALAVELLHNYSLVHDDIEDGDALRHGRTTVWKRYGFAHGINAGDSLCAVSYLTLMRNSTGRPADHIAALTRALHAANFAMCAGQSFDIAFETATNVTMDAYLAMIDGKTAALFGAACTLGALCAGADNARAHAYGEMGSAYGRAFQIRDDILGTWASRDQTGKPLGSDIGRRKWTFPIVWALAGPPSQARDTIAAHYASTEPPSTTGVARVVAALNVLHARPIAEAAWRAQAAEAARIAEFYRLDGRGDVRELFVAGCAAIAGRAR